MFAGQYEHNYTFQPMLNRNVSTLKNVRSENSSSPLSSKLRDYLPPETSDRCINPITSQLWGLSNVHATPRLTSSVVHQVNTESPTNFFCPPKTLWPPPFFSDMCQSSTKALENEKLSSVNSYICAPSTEDFPLDLVCRRKTEHGFKSECQSVNEKQASSPSSPSTSAPMAHFFLKCEPSLNDNALRPSVTIAIPPPAHINRHPIANIITDSPHTQPSEHLYEKKPDVNPTSSTRKRFAETTSARNSVSVNGFFGGFPTTPMPGTTSLLSSSMPDMSQYLAAMRTPFSPYMAPGAPYLGLSAPLGLHAFPGVAAPHLSLGRLNGSLSPSERDAVSQCK